MEKIFEGSILAKVFTFSGEIRLIPFCSEETLEDEKEIGVMSELEKILYSLSEQRKDDLAGAMAIFSGKKEGDMSDEEKVTAQEEILKEENSETLKKFQQLATEEEAFLKIMWCLIKTRISTSDPRLRLAPEHKILSGYNYMDRLNYLFGM